MKKMTKFLAAFFVAGVFAAVCPAQNRADSERKEKMKWIAAQLRQGENDHPTQRSKYKQTKIADIEFDGCRVTIKKKVTEFYGRTEDKDILTDEKYQVNALKNYTRDHITIFDLKTLDAEQTKIAKTGFENFPVLKLVTQNEDREIFTYPFGDLKKAPQITAQIGFLVKKENAERLVEEFSALIKSCRQ